MGQGQGVHRENRLETRRPVQGGALGRVQTWLTRPQTAFHSMTSALLEKVCRATHADNLQSTADVPG